MYGTNEEYNFPLSPVEVGVVVVVGFTTTYAISAYHH